MIAIINYGLSNLLSIKRAVDLYMDDVGITDQPDDLKKADKIILPGVGSFHYGMQRLNCLGLAEMVMEKAKEGIPVLGICLGMQMLFDEGEEGGRCEGLKLIPGRIVKIPENDINGSRQIVPHVGWEKLTVNEKASGMNGRMRNVLHGQEFYFIHSYEAKTVCEKHCIASIDYGGRRVCGVAKKDNVMGCQFHPEKSGPAGLKVIRNFIYDF